MILACLPAASSVLPKSVIGAAIPITAVSGVIGLATIAAWHGVWLLSGRVTPAYVGLALSPAWAMAEFAGTPLGSTVEHSMASFTWLLPPSIGLVLLRQSRRRPDVDTSLRPFRTLFYLLGAVAAALAIAYALVHMSMHSPKPAVVLIGAASAALWFRLALAWEKTLKFDIVYRRRMAVAMLTFGLAVCDRTFGLLNPPDELRSFAFTSGGIVALVGWSLALMVALEAFAEARMLASNRQHVLRGTRDAVLNSLSEHRIRGDERSHDLRSLAAGIQCATATLARYRDHLDPAEQRDLEDALLAEITRLQQEISAEPRGHRVFSVAAALEPVIMAERVQGAVVDVELADLDAVGDAGATAALLQNLMTNSRRHAPGSTIVVRSFVDAGQVRVSVSDDGPGLPEPMRRGVRDLLDGAARPSVVDMASPGATGTSPLNVAGLNVAGDRHGLGLAICSRLAREQGGALRLVETTAGTCFEFGLPLAAEAVMAG